MSCKNNRRIMKKMLASGTMDATAVNRLTAKAKLRKGTDALYEVYVNAILSGPITHGVNITSNLVLTTWSPTQKWLEGVSAFARQDFEKASIDFAQSRQQLVGLVEGITDVFRLYNKHNQGDLTRLGYDPTIEIGVEKLKKRHHPSISSENDGLLGDLVNRVGTFVRMPGNLLLEEDKWFKMIHYRMHTNSSAMGKAMQATSDPQQQKNLYNFFKNNPDDTTVQTAKNLGEYYTFTDQLGKHGRKGSSWVRGIPGMRYLVPFINTPTNIVKMGLNNGMYGNVFKDLKPALSSTATRAEKDAARAKIAMGTFAPLAVMSLLDGETITGRIDMATQEGRFKAEQDKPAYSFRVGGTWYSYEKIEPLRSILGVYVTAKEAITNMDQFDPDTGEPNPLIDQIFIGAIAPVIQTVADNYMLNEIGGTLDILTSVSVGNPDTFLETFQRVSQNMAVPAGIRQINRVAFDDTFRQAEGYMQGILKGIPGFSDELPARRTLWGDEQHYPDSLFADIISPVYTASVKQDVIDRHMIDLEVPIRGVPKNVSFFGGKGQKPIVVPLTAEQREAYSIIRGKGAGNNTPTLKESITIAYNNPRYKKLSNMDKRIILGNIMNKYSEIALKSLRGLQAIQNKRTELLQMRETERRRTQQ